MTSESRQTDQSSAFNDIEFQVMPGDEGGWYWEVILGWKVIVRGVAGSEPAACKQASDVMKAVGIGRSSLAGR